MDIDHIFIFTDTKGEIAEELIAFGLTANESRVHQGQGTMNRTFSFSNFFLEIAWVCNQAEIKSELVKSTGLWQRADYFSNGYSPFGLVITNNDSSDHLFTNAIKYQPSYFSSGLAFEIITNHTQPGLPWTCRMPLQTEQNPAGNYTKHQNGIQALSGATFDYMGTGDESFVQQFSTEKTMLFILSCKNWLTLTFDNGRQGLKKVISPLQLTIEY